MFIICPERFSPFFVVFAYVLLCRYSCHIACVYIYNSARGLAAIPFLVRTVFFFDAALAIATAMLLRLHICFLSRLPSIPFVAGVVFLHYTKMMQQAARFDRLRDRNTNLRPKLDDAQAIAATEHISKVTMDGESALNPAVKQQMFMSNCWVCRTRVLNSQRPPAGVGAPALRKIARANKRLACAKKGMHFVHSNS